MPVEVARFGSIAAVNADLDEAQELGLFFFSSESQPSLSQIVNLAAPRKKKKEGDICIKVVSGVYHLKVTCIASY